MKSKMACYWPIYLSFLITLMALTTNFASADTTVAISEGKSLIETIDKFLTDMNRHCQRNTSSVQSLKKNVIVIGDKITSLVSDLEAWEKRSTPGVTTPPIPRTCEDGWIRHGASCYMPRMCIKDCEYIGVALACKRKNAKLAKIPSCDVKNFIISIVKGSRNVILGGTARAARGIWRWPDGSLINEGYTIWGDGIPPGSKRKCMYMTTGRQKWMDYGCDYVFKASQKAAFVCEK